MTPKNDGGNWWWGKMMVIIWLWYGYDMVIIWVNNGNIWRSPEMKVITPKYGWLKKRILWTFGWFFWGSPMTQETSKWNFRYPGPFNRCGWNDIGHDRKDICRPIPTDWRSGLQRIDGSQSLGPTSSSLHEIHWKFPSKSKRFYPKMLSIKVEVLKSKSLVVLTGMGLV